MAIFKENGQLVIEELIKTTEEKSPCLSKISSLCLSNINTGNEGAIAIAKCMALTNLQTLDLSGNDIGAVGARAIAMFETLTNLQNLDLKNNKIGDGGASAIAKFKTLTNLQSLDLSNNKISDGGAKAISKSKTLKNLQSLSLSSNDIGPKGARAIAKSKTLRNLQSLILRNNKIIGNEGARAILKSKTLTNLQSLNLSSNNIGPEGAEAIIQSKTLTNLQHLDLNRNQIGKEGARAIEKSKTLTNLQSLILSGNNIGPEGAEAIAKSKTLTNLQYLHLNRNRIGNEGARAIEKSETLTNLRELDLSSNNIGPEGAESIAKSKALTNLQSLYLNSNRIAPKGARAIKNSKTLTNLGGFDFQNNEISHEKAKDILVKFNEKSGNKHYYFFIIDESNEEVGPECDVDSKDYNNWAKAIQESGSYEYMNQPSLSSVVRSIDHDRPQSPFPSISSNIDRQDNKNIINKMLLSINEVFKKKVICLATNLELWYKNSLSPKLYGESELIVINETNIKKSILEVAILILKNNYENKKEICLADIKEKLKESGIPLLGYTSEDLTIPILQEDKDKIAKTRNEFTEIFKEFSIQKQVSDYYFIPSSEPRSHKDIKTKDRRLDTLARILTGNNICSAVMIHNNQLIVANNEGQHDYHKKIMNKLKDTLSTNQDEIIKDLVNIQFQVLNENRTKKFGRRYSYDDKMVTCIIDSISWVCSGLDGCGKDIIKLQYKGSLSFSQEVKAVNRIVHDIKKFVLFLQTQDAQELKDKIKNEDTEKNTNILYLNENEKNLPHAEMQILDFIHEKLKNAEQDKEPKYILKKLKNEIREEYVGVSKLCCLGCSITIEVLLGKDITRGAHNIAFGGWVTPKFIMDNKELLEDPIIKKLEGIENELSTNGLLVKHKNRAMSATMSNSSGPQIKHEQNIAETSLY